jgi:hypothetical protein
MFVVPAHSICIPESIAQVRAVMQQCQASSARWHVVTLQMSGRSHQRILHEDLRLYPYKIHITHKLREQDKASRGNFLDLLHNEGVLNVLIV